MAEIETKLVSAENNGFPAEDEKMRELQIFFFALMYEMAL